MSILLIFGCMTKANYQDFQVSKYGTLVTATVVGRDCSGSSVIYVEYSEKKYSIYVSFLNCVEDFPDGSKVTAKYLDGNYLQLKNYYSTTWVIVMELITLFFLIISAIPVYQLFFLKETDKL